VIELQPHFLGGGVEIVNEALPAKIPAQFVETVIAALRAACDGGFGTAYPVTDVIVRIVDGSCHEADSSELAVKMAGFLALKDAINSAGPYVFDPGSKPVNPNERLDVRPAVVVSRGDSDGSTDPVICVPLTTRNRGSCYEVEIGQPPFLDQELWAYVRGIAAFEPQRLTQLLGRVTPEQLGTIRVALKYSMEL
jgi:mRNA-degrading endonuclease toxin of MazEF toxin-antitoxin module